MLSRSRKDAGPRRPDIRVLRNVGSPGIFSPDKTQATRLEPTRFEPQRHAEANPSVTFRSNEGSPRTGDSRFPKIVPRTPYATAFDDIEQPEPLRLENTQRNPSQLRERLVRSGNLPPVQELTAVDRDAQNHGVSTTTLENLPENLQASKRQPVDQNLHFRDLQKKLGFYRQEVMLYKVYHSAYVRLKTKIDEVQTLQSELVERLADADQALKEYWAQHRDDGSEEEIVFSEGS